MIPRSRQSKQQGSKGIALIMVLMVVTVLTVLAGGFAYSMKIETKLARNASWESEFEWMGRSGIEIARFALSQRTAAGANYEALCQAWAGGTKETNDYVAALLGHWIPVSPSGDAQIFVTLEDEERRMNINFADLMVLDKAMEVVNVDAALGPSIRSAILDWRDRDDMSQTGGAETSYYMGLSPPYRAKNGDFSDIFELLLVKGITESPGIFWGPEAPPHMRRRAEPGMPEEDQVYPIGFKQLFTAVSVGKININTADVNAMQVIPFMNKMWAENIQKLRAGEDGVDGTFDDQPFPAIPNLPGMPPPLVGALQQYADVHSRTFRVITKVKAGKFHRTYEAIIQGTGTGPAQVRSFTWH